MSNDTFQPTRAPQASKASKADRLRRPKRPPEHEVASFSVDDLVLAKKEEEKKKHALNYLLKIPPSLADPTVLSRFECVGTLDVLHDKIIGEDNIGTFAVYEPYNKIYTYDVPELSGIIARFIQALATGEDFSISAAEMPMADIPERERLRLAERWAADVARIAPSVKPERPETATLAPQPIPKSWDEAKAQVPTLLEWKTGKLPGDTAPDFIKRHYGNWLGKGLGRADIRRIDPTLERAVQNYLRGQPLPEDCPLPTVKEKNDLRVAKATVSLGVAEGEKTLRSLGQALASRERRGRT